MHVFNLTIYNLGRVQWKGDFVFSRFNIKIPKHSGVYKALFQQAFYILAGNCFVFQQTCKEVYKVITVCCLVVESFIVSGLVFLFCLFGKDKV